MRLFLDCEFTQLSQQAKLTSLALVAVDGQKFYVELLNTWRACSDFVKEIALPKRWEVSTPCRLLMPERRSSGSWQPMTESSKLSETHLLTTGSCFASLPITTGNGPEREEFPH
ncbi:hypothetical protein [Pseudomonas mosselii]|uniref:hypothetical protein n=1 Tax=Pseudomonas mosselii TaxID=78327 RepID=UPI0020C81355|nr:hypothetical protein [Pseudomonas mosselii]